MDCTRWLRGTLQGGLRGDRGKMAWSLWGIKNSKQCVLYDDENGAIEDLEDMWAIRDYEWL